MTDAIWNAFVTHALRLGATDERPSRFADKPALWVHDREIAHCEVSGVIDLRITAAGWRTVRDRFGTDPAVTKLATRRDWLELHIATPADCDTYAELVAQAVASNS